MYIHILKLLKCISPTRAPTFQYSTTMRMQQRVKTEQNYVLEKRPIQIPTSQDTLLHIPK
jgi:hypothetical protein